MDRRARERLEDAAYDFERVVWPATRSAVGGGTYRSIELSGTRVLDQLAGMDIYHELDRRVVRAFSVRVQWDWQSWRTFTIRFSLSNGAATQFEKALAAYEYRDRGALYPHLAIHAYVARPARYGELIEVGICRLEPLIRLLEAELERCPGCIPRYDGRTWGIKWTQQRDASFLVAHWDWMRAHGVRVRTIRGGDKTRGIDTLRERQEGYRAIAGLR